MKAPGELHLVESIRRRAAYPKLRALIQGIGDDCAVLRPPAHQDLVFTTDFVLEDRHFSRQTHTPAEIGHKALARSLSDLAAMGAKPLIFLVSLALPSAGSSEFIGKFYKGMLALAKEHNIALAGGDLAQFSQVAADVMCCGSVPVSKSLLRSAAKPGDFIYTTGTLGHSALGFRTQRGAAWKRHRMPVPRVEVGMQLYRHGVRCAMDLSDGLSLDLARLCRESGVGAELTTPLPIEKGATLDDALHGGEDYELLFTAATRRKIPAVIAGVPITRIGRITGRHGVAPRLDGKPIPQKGFDHFA